VVLGVKVPRGYRPAMRATTARRVGGLALATAVVPTVVLAPVAHAADGLRLKATVNGASLTAAGANDPIVLRPSDDQVVSVAVTNTGSSPVELRSVRLQARVLGLAFFSYTTRVDLVVAPGATGTRTFALDMTDLDGQATGLMPTEVALLGPHREVLVSGSGTVDVKGKLLSVYGVFGLAVAGVTALLLLGLLLRLVRRTLPDQRVARALQAAVPGTGLGLVAAFTLGALRVAVPSTGTCVVLLVGGFLLGLVLGALTPAPGAEADRDELDERDVVAVPVYAPPPVPTQAPPPPAPAASAVDDDPRQTRVVGPPPPPSA
jgi:hypothetical protein